MKYFAIALASAALTGAQTPGISIRPNSTGPALGVGLGTGSAVVGSRLGAPILGYIIGPGPLDLRMITGTPKAAQLGGAVVLPAGVKRLFLPPREHYVLLESKTNQPLAIWWPERSDSEETPLPAALAHPDSVSFSARGDAAALYSKSGDHLQIIAGLPAEPSLATLSGVSQWGEASSFALSDDGAVVIASMADGSAVASLRGADWQRLPVAYNARTLLFVPRTHNLLVSDTAQQTVTLVTNVAESTQATRLIAHNVSADRLAITREGTVLLAASSSQGKIWTVDLKTMTPASVSSSSVDTLLPMRDGHTFLLSSPGVALLNVPVDGDRTAGFVPVTR